MANRIETEKIKQRINSVDQEDLIRTENIRLRRPKDRQGRLHQQVPHRL